MSDCFYQQTKARIFNKYGSLMLTPAHQSQVALFSYRITHLTEHREPQGS